MKIPRRYQRKAAERASRKNTLLTDECGLGKTITAITAARLAEAKSILVVCPLRVKPQWELEIADQVSFDTKITGLKYGIPFKYYDDREGWFIGHYEAVAADPSLAGVLWDFMIVDEAHRIKNRNTNWTKELKHIPAVRKMALTGTPMEKNPADLWSVLNWLYPSTYRSYWRFYEKYVAYEIRGWQKKYKYELGPKNVGKLSKELVPVMLRRTKKEVEPELPERIEQAVFVPMNKKQQKLYNSIRKSKDIVFEHQDKEVFIANALSLFTKLHQVSVMPQLLDWNYSSSKFEWLMEWLQDNPEPVVVFSRYRGVIQRVYDAVECDVIVGGVRELPHRFLNGEVRVVAGTVGAMGEGLNLQRAEVAIFLDQVWSTTQMSQAIDRIHRIGIDSPRVIYYLHSSKTDLHVYEAIEKKWSDSEMVYEAVKNNVL